MSFNRLSVLMMSLCMASAALAVDPAMQPTTRPLRASREVLADWREATDALRAILPSPQAVADPEARKQVAPQAVPALKRALAITDELYQVDSASRAQTRQTHYHLLAILAYLDDADALAELDDARQSNHKEVALLGRHAWYLAQWWRNAADPAKSATLLDELEALAKQKPTDDDLTSLLVQIREEGTSGKEQTARIEAIIRDHLRGPAALRVIDQLKASDKRKTLLGKPLVIDGTTLQGKRFSSASFKGKYVVVHFGATWCGPWEQEHNRLMELYPDLDTTRVALVTVLCDLKPQAMADYRACHKEIPWPTLWEAPTADSPRRPISFAAEYGVEDLPTTLVIAPNGICELVDVTPSPKLLEILQTPVLPTTGPTGGQQPATRP